MLAPAAGSRQVDATLGGGGHAERILTASSPDGRLLGLDADGAAIARVRARLAPRFGARLQLRQANFRELGSVAPEEGFAEIDGCLFDLGLSSFQLADADRGLRLPDDRRAGHALRHGPRRAGRGAHRDARRHRADRALPALRRGAVRGPDRTGDRRDPPDRADQHRRRARRTRRARRALARAGPAPRPSRDPRLPGPAHRRQRGARRARGGPRVRGRPAPARRPARGPELPLPRGPHRQALPPGRAAGLHLPAPRSRCACAAASRACACSRRRASSRARPRSPPTRAPGARGCAPPSGWPPSRPATRRRTRRTRRTRRGDRGRRSPR